MPHPSCRCRAVHWPHLLLLAGLAAWLPATAALPAPARVLGWLLIALAWLGLAECLQPYRPDWRPDRPALRRDGSVLALNLVVDGLLSALLALLAVALAPAHSPLPLALQALLGLAFGELLAYALHRASHRGGWLWRVHLLHHRPERLNLANALTVHPFNLVYDKLAHVLPMLLLGLSEQAVLAVSLFTLSQALVAHANIAGTLGPLRRLIGSAELHRLHHSTDPTQAGNFGTAVPWWDLLFGSFRWRAEAARVGVFAPGDYPSEHALAALLAWPLRRPGDPAPGSGRRGSR